MNVHCKDMSVLIPSGSLPENRKQNKPMNTANQIPSSFKTISRKATLTAAVLTTALWSANASAGTITLLLAKSSLTNVTDAAGLNQYESGDVKKGTTVIGQYQIVRRVTTPPTTTSTSQYVAAASITLFLGTSATTPNTELHNIVLSGAHGFSAGNFKGSVSAASNKYSWIIGADSGCVSAGTGLTNLTINWNGSNQLTVP